MPKIEKTKIIKDGVYHKRYREVLAEAGPTDKKAAMREKIDHNVFDVYDSVADNAKWAAILTTAISIMYTALDADTKARMDPRQKALMDMLVSTYAATKTRFEIQYEEEGIGLILKMLERQKAVGDIVAAVKKGDR